MKPVTRTAAVASLHGIEAMLARLPGDCEWFETTWAEIDARSLRHVFSDDWAAVSGGTGRVEASARAILDGDDGEVAARVRSIAATFDPARCGPLLLGANDLAGPFVILDGNHRATAIALRHLGGDPLDIPALRIVVARSRKPIFDWGA